MFTPFVFIRIRGGGTDPQFDRHTRKNGNTGRFFHEKNGLRICIAPLYIFWRVVWKMYHPCFFGWLGSNRAGDDFLRFGALFCLYRFVGIFFALHDDFFFFRLFDTDHHNKPGL